MLLLLTLMVFLLMRVIPGDPALLILAGTGGGNWRRPPPRILKHGGVGLAEMRSEQKTTCQTVGSPTRCTHGKVNGRRQPSTTRGRT